MIPPQGEIRISLKSAYSSNANLQKFRVKKAESAPKQLEFCEILKEIPVQNTDLGVPSLTESELESTPDEICEVVHVPEFN